MSDQDWTDRLRDAYRPPEMNRQQAAAFDAALSERLQRRRWRMPAMALGGLALAAAALALWVAQPAPAVGPAPQLVAVADLGVTPQQVATAEPEPNEVLALLDTEWDDDEALPDDYLALADALEF